MPLTRFLVHPQIFLYLEEHKDEREDFLQKVVSYYLKYAIREKSSKKDESYEFKDKSFFILSYNDVEKIVNINHHSKGGS